MLVLICGKHHESFLTYLLLAQNLDKTRGSMVLATSDTQTRFSSSVKIVGLMYGMYVVVLKLTSYEMDVCVK